MKYIIELEVEEKDYVEFIKYFDEDFDEWEDPDAVEDKVYDILSHESYHDLMDAPYVYVNES